MCTGEEGRGEGTAPAATRARYLARSNCASVSAPDARSDAGSEPARDRSQSGRRRRPAPAALARVPPRARRCGRPCRRRRCRRAKRGAVAAPAAAPLPPAPGRFRVGAGAIPERASSSPLWTCARARRPRTARRCRRGVPSTSQPAIWQLDDGRDAAAPPMVMRSPTVQVVRRRRGGRWRSAAARRLLLERRPPQLDGGARPARPQAHGDGRPSCLAQLGDQVSQTRFPPRSTSAAWRLRYLRCRRLVRGDGGLRQAPALLLRRRWRRKRRPPESLLRTPSRYAIHFWDRVQRIRPCVLAAEYIFDRMERLRR